MKRSQIIAVGILIAVGGLLAAAYFQLVPWPLDYVYVGAAVLLVGLGVGQALKKSDLVYLVAVLALAGAALVLTYTGNLPFDLVTTPEHAYVGGTAFSVGIGTGRVL
jgi:hypothetical protein